MNAAHAMLDELCRERYGHLMALATMLAGPDDAEDLLHEALIASFGSSRRFASLNAADAYVRRAISTRFIDSARKHNRRRRGERQVAALRAPETHDNLPFDTALQDALHQLPPRVRACVVLRFLDDLSTAETASILGLSEGAVKRYVSDGTAALSEVLGSPATSDAPRRISLVERRERR